MIKANELRIGNWVNFMEDDTKFKVLTIESGGMSVESEDEETWIEYDQFSGIDLTPEILEKAGFRVRKSAINSIKEYYIGTNPVTNDWLFELSYIDADGYREYFYRNGHFKIKHVHNLQNLYFSLTGNELTIQL